ncbi:DUF6193 family natural product biosynthesis protein [Streptomyces parvus]|uniref:DUF6193 family natural product biosynthesis protein n=1 Tax=Streptomyces parvus TaxID=66428 RepID=UPI0033E2D1CF
MAAENGAGTPGSVIREWQSVLAEPSGVIDPALARAAHAHPRLRSLFPLISHGSLQFSRCTRPPWSRDVPSLFRRRDGRFSVIRLWETGESGHRCVGVATPRRRQSRSFRRPCPKTGGLPSRERPTSCDGVRLPPLTAADAGSP